MAQKSFNTGNIAVDDNIQIHYISAPNRQIGPRFIKIEPNPDHFPVQIRIKSGPKWPPNLDQFYKISF